MNDPRKVWRPHSEFVYFELRAYTIPKGELPGDSKIAMSQMVLVLCIYSPIYDR